VLRLAVLNVALRVPQELQWQNPKIIASLAAEAITLRLALLARHVQRGLIMTRKEP